MGFMDWKCWCTESASEDSPRMLQNEMEELEYRISRCSCYLWDSKAW